MNKKLGEAITRVVSRPLFWVAIMAIMFAVPIVRTLAFKPPPRLPVLAEVPAFTLKNQHGEPFGSENLRGHVWVANFIFTRCPSICPLVTAKMQEVQHRARNLGTAFQIVSFSVDPDHDTPEVLLAYGKQKRVSFTRWSFLTGAWEDVRRTVEKGLKNAMGRETSAEDLPSVTHGTHFVLVDRDLRIRGYYDSSDPRAVNELLYHASLLLNRGD